MQVPTSQMPPVPPPIYTSRVQSQRPSLAPPRTAYVPATMLPGFFVNSESDINANDVPSDGSISIFPYRDLSRIVIKQWSGPSTLESATYVLEQSPQQTTQAALPPPPPPSSISQQQTDDHTAHAQSDATNELVNAVGQLTGSIANSFSQIDSTLKAMQINLERLNSRFIDDEARG